MALYSVVTPDNHLHCIVRNLFYTITALSKVTINHIPVPKTITISQDFNHAWLKFTSPILQALRWGIASSCFVPRLVVNRKYRLDVILVLLVLLLLLSLLKDVDFFLSKNYV